MDQAGPVFKQPESNLYPGIDGSAPPLEPPSYAQQPGYTNYPPQQPQQLQMQYVQPPGPNVVIINQQPQTMNPKGQPQNIRDWSTGLCDCFGDIGGCLYCTFCFPCFTCTLANRMNECCLGPLCCPGFLVAMRSKMRGQFGITGSICNDGCCMTWCTPCATHQMYRELDRTLYSA